MAAVWRASPTPRTSSASAAERTSARPLYRRTDERLSPKAAVQEAKNQPMPAVKAEAAQPRSQVPPPPLPKAEAPQPKSHLMPTPAPKVEPSPPKSEPTILFKPETAAEAWLDEHCPPDGEHRYWCGALVVEHRYVKSIVRLAAEDGLVIGI